MIDTAEQTACEACGAPIVQAARRGPYKKRFCNPICRKRANRAKGKQEQETPEALIAALQEEVQELKERLKQIASVDEYYRYENRKRPFKKWLSTQPAYKQNDFAKRALEDRDFPREMSRSFYQQYLRTRGYSDEDRLAFVDAWKEMLTTELIKMHQLEYSVT